MTWVDAQGAVRQHSVLRRVLRRRCAMGFALKRVLGRVLRKGSEKGAFQKVPSMPP